MSDADDVMDIDVEEEEGEESDDGREEGAVGGEDFSSVSRPEEEPPEKGTQSEDSSSVSRPEEKPVQKRVRKRKQGYATEKKRRQRTNRRLRGQQSHDSGVGSSPGFIRGAPRPESQPEGRPELESSPGIIRGASRSEPPQSSSDTLVVDTGRPSRRVREVKVGGKSLPDFKMVVTPTTPSRTFLSPLPASSPAPREAAGRIRLEHVQEAISALRQPPASSPALREAAGGRQPARPPVSREAAGSRQPSASVVGPTTVDTATSASQSDRPVPPECQPGTSRGLPGRSLETREMSGDLVGRWLRPGRPPSPPPPGEAAANRGRAIEPSWNRWGKHGPVAGCEVLQPVKPGYPRNFHLPSAPSDEEEVGDDWAVDSHCHWDRLLWQKHYGCIVTDSTGKGIVPAMKEVERYILTGEAGRRHRPTKVLHLQYMVAVFCDPESWRQAAVLAEADPRIVFTVGLHPNHTSKSKC